MFKYLFNKIKEKKEVERLKQEQELAKFEAELLDPDFGVIEISYGKPISASLRSLYENKIEITKEYTTKIIDGVSEDEWILISSYWPLNKTQVEGQWVQNNIHFAFAGDGSGSEWVVDPTEENGVIYFFEHETGELIPTEVTINQYLMLRETTDET